jgi:hypothetical protein
VREAPAPDAADELSAILPDGIKVGDAFALLRGPAEDEATEVYTSRQELFSLRVWLALREDCFCEIYVPESANTGAIPAYLRRDRTFATAIGLCATDGCCVIKLEEDADGYPTDPKRPLRLVIRRFGTAHTLAERLREQIQTWDRAGHPFVWNIDGFRARMWDVHLLAYPRDARELPAALKHETLLIRRHTAFLFTENGLESPASLDRE